MTMLSALLCSPVEAVRKSLVRNVPMPKDTARMVSRTTWKSVFHPRALFKIQFITLLLYFDAFFNRQRVRKNERF
jgi:hypothetical protein